MMYSIMKIMFGISDVALSGLNAATATNFIHWASPNADDKALSRLCAAEKNIIIGEHPMLITKP